MFAIKRKHTGIFTYALSHHTLQKWRDRERENEIKRENIYIERVGRRERKREREKERQTDRQTDI